MNINLLHLNTRELENQSINRATLTSTMEPHVFSGNNGLVKPALNVISVFLKLLWMLHYITHSTVMIKIFTIYATFFELNHVHVNSQFNLGKNGHHSLCLLCYL